MKACNRCNSTNVKKIIFMSKEGYECNDCGFFDKLLGIAKRDIKAGETFSIPIEVTSGKYLENDTINFLEGASIHD